MVARLRHAGSVEHATAELAGRLLPVRRMQEWLVFEEQSPDWSDFADEVPGIGGERALRSAKPHRPKVTKEQVLDSIAETEGLEAGFVTTYQPSRYETGWLLSSLRLFYDQTLITDVLAQVRGGKEASVYRCRAHPSTGVDLVAAKVYRPRQFRSLRNDKVYRQGRTILTADGRPVKKTDHRIMRALGKKTAFGQEVAHTSWLMHEFTTLGLLYRLGAAVPQPHAASENAILMGYRGDEGMAAPTLNEVDLSPEEAGRVFDEVIGNVELMLRQGIAHGDLSAYNVLYWDGAITIIDFPQVVDCEGNPDAYPIHRRDIRRLCDYFARQGVERDADALAEDLWRSCVGEIPEPQVLPEEVEDGGWGEDDDW
ncbi:MAG: RIO1 family regulatory kinase/ATPase domain-containing protein [Anaerolineae bacterium]